MGGLPIGYSINVRTSLQLRKGTPKSQKSTACNSLERKGEMGESRENPRSGIAELSKIFEEYKSKLEGAERESQEIINRAWQKAESIIAEAQRKVQGEAEKIIRDARLKAEQIVKEADEKVRKEAKEKVKKETERVIAEAKHSAEKQAAEIIAASRREAEMIIGEAKEYVRAETQKEAAKVLAEAQKIASEITSNSIASIDETSKLLTETLKKAEETVKRYEMQMQSDLGQLLLEIARARERLESQNEAQTAKSFQLNGSGKTAESKSLAGSKKLEIAPPYDAMQIKKLVDFLKKVPKIQLAGEAYDDNIASIYINILEPLPLLAVLSEMSLIAGFTTLGDTIKLKLVNGRNVN